VRRKDQIVKIHSIGERGSAENKRIEKIRKYRKKKIVLNQKRKRDQDQDKISVVKREIIAIEALKNVEISSINGIKISSND
jgi:C-terminal processing protease CtpA/Prc